jgi:transcriptional regulator with XRE-family HTH domain
MESLKDKVELLLSAGWTQTSISKESGVGQPTISRLLMGNGIAYESGKKIEMLYDEHVSARPSSKPSPQSIAEAKKESPLIPGRPIDGAVVRETTGKTRRVGDQKGHLE